ncbi:hypothetical protein [Empedobacter sp. GD03739]|uniref:hypothetical protein n=1 Tax=Empedobacter sp. GD03739 TaxID=2975376 RepID=UPI00244C18CC|nr:hypothetical protein [Empedobacter sp. GD03739]MDH1602347.1 hypothetical protein [Empedobacter sp. GD03739]
MIDVLTNGFLTNPIPIQFTGNYCSHGCVYCFSNINNPKRKLDVKGVLSQLKNFKKRDDLASFYMREKYPILFSNNIDPFSKSNQPYVNDLILTLRDLEIPVALATRGGQGWKDIYQEITPSVFYVTIPYSDDVIREKYEPKAPSLSERWEMTEELIKQGHKVIISINPLNKTFCSNPLEIISEAQKLGVESFVINKLHLTPKQQSNLTDREKSILGTELLTEAKSKGFQDNWIDQGMEMMNYCSENNLNLLGMDTGLTNSNYFEFKQCYDNLLPTLDDFFNWVSVTKEIGDYIYFEEFYNFFSVRLPDLQGNISKYIFNRAVINDKDFYKKMDLRNLLHLYWQHSKAGLNIPANYPSFSWVKKQYSTKLDFLFDDEHNQIMIYHGDEFNANETVII